MKLYGDGIHDDTHALQELLDGRGIVRIEKPGTYLVSKTLIIHSNTRFELSPGAKLLAAPLSRCALMEGNALGHLWTEATCTRAKTCDRCAATAGQPL